MSQQEQLSAELLTKTLRSRFPETEGSFIEVEDISGGCGSMFKVRVDSPQFTDLSKVKQHKLINEVLQSEIKQMHGIVVETKALPPLDKK